MFKSEGPDRLRMHRKLSCRILSHKFGYMDAGCWMLEQFVLCDQVGILISEADVGNVM